MIKILYVDDETELLEIGKLFLESSNELQVDTAPSVSLAVKKLDLAHYDAIVSDYQMPGRDGIQFLKSLRAAGDQIPFILFTGKGREEVVIEALNSGANFYLQKGGDPKAQFHELEHHIMVAVRHNRAEESLKKNNEELHALNNQLAAAELELRKQLDAIIEGQDELKKEMTFSESIMESLPGIFYLYDAKTMRLVRWNKNHQDVSGYTAEEMFGKHILEWFRPEDRDVVWAAIERSMMKGQDGVEAPLLMKDGNVVPYLFTGNRFDTKERSFLMGFGIDISERRRAEKELHDGEQKYRAITENMADVVTMLDMDLRITYVSPSIKGLRGLTVEEMMGQSIDRILTPESMRMAFDTIAEEIELRKNGKVGLDKARYLELEENGRDGSRICVGNDISFIPGEDGLPKAIVVISRDITAQKKLNQSMRQAVAAMENSIDGIALLDTEGKYIFLNQAHAEIYGYDAPNDLMGKSWRTLYDVDELDQFDHHHMPEFSRKGFWRGSSIGMKRDGTKFVQELSLTKLEDGGLICIVRDNSEMARAKEDLRQKTALFEAQVNASLDGILVIDENNKRIIVNQRIVDLFQVPQHIMENEDDNYLLNHVVGLTKNPRQFLDKVKYLNDHINETGRDEIEFKNGMVLDRYSAPVFGKDGEYHGRTWTFRDVTEPKRAEKALESSQHLLSKIVETTLGLIFVYDLKENRNVYANRGMAEFLGYDPKQIKEMGSGLLEKILHPDDVAEVHRFQDELRKLPDGEIQELHYRLLRADGNWCQVRNRSMVFERDPDGSARSELGIVEDVTEKKKAEEALEESERRYRSLFDSTIEGMAVHEILLDSSGLPYDYRFLDINPAFERMTGLARENVLGKTVRELMPGIEPTWIGHYGKVALTGEPEYFEDYTETLDKTFEVFVYRNAPMQFTVNFSDVTDRKRMEKALRDSEEKFREIFNHANDAIQVHDMDEKGIPGQFFDINEVACRMLGYSREEMLQMRPLDLVSSYHDPPVEKVFDELKNNGLSRFETGYRHKDGRIIPVEINAHLVHMQGKMRVIAVVRDITERKRNLDAIRLANKKLSLLSGITRHDLTNQLMVLAGNLDLMNDLAPSGPLNDNLQRSIASAERITNIVQFTKVYEDIGVQAPVWQNVNAMVEKAAKQVAGSDIGVISEISSDIEVFADPLIQNVFNNLIDNAIRHGGSATSVRFSAEKIDGKDVLICEDNGDGVPLGMKEMLFTRGFGKNHGLGLFLSREILAITGIEIEEKGVPGKGARFVLTPSNGLRRV